MEQLTLFDNTFTLSKITAYSLSIEIDYNHLSYTIIDTIRKRFVALVYKKFDVQLTKQNFLDYIQALISKDSYLQKHYKEVDFIFPSEKFLLVPGEYFDKKYLKELFEIDNELEESEELQFNYISEIDAYLVFAISSEITNFFVFRFPEINFYHQAIPVIKSYLAYSKTKQTPVVVINVRRRFLVDVLIVFNNQVLYYNIFKCKGEEQAVYDIINVLKNYGLNLPVEIIGDVSEKNDKLYALLSRYLPNLTFAKLHKDYTIDFSQPVPIHKFVNLFYLSN